MIPAGLAVNTEYDRSAWYASRRLEKSMLAEFMLAAGKSHDFEITARGRTQLYVGFLAKEEEAIRTSYKGLDAIEMVSHAARNDPLQSNLGGGMEWAAESGKLRFTIKNRSKVDTRVVIHTRKEQREGVEFVLVGARAARGGGNTGPAGGSRDTAGGSPEVDKLRNVYEAKAKGIYDAYNAAVDGGGLLRAAATRKTKAFVELTAFYTAALDRLAAKKPGLAAEIKQEKQRVAGILANVKAFRDRRGYQPYKGSQKPPKGQPPKYQPPVARPGMPGKKKVPKSLRRKGWNWPLVTTSRWTSLWAGPAASGS